MSNGIAAKETSATFELNGRKGQRADHTHLPMSCLNPDAKQQL